MDYRLGKTDDIQSICNLVKTAIDTMEKQGIKQCDEAYTKCKWENVNETACIIHRLCVSPEYQNKGYADWRKGRFWLMEKKL